MFASFRKAILFGSLPLVLAVSGCGGGSSVDDAILVDAPDAVTATPAAGTAPAAAAPVTAPVTATPIASAAGVASTATPAAASAAVSAEGWGTLKGKVTLNGTDPKFGPLDSSSKDPEVCAKTPVPNEKLVVGADSGVKYAIVYLPKPTKVNDDAKKAATTASLVFDQDKCVFKPHVLATMVGAKIKIKSSDTVGHNVNSKVDNNAFNMAVSTGQEIEMPLTAAARKPGLLVCDIHPWMSAYWLILDNPYFAVTDENGNYEIKNVPAGTQKVVVWQEGVTFVTPTAGKDVTIAASGETVENFAVDATKVKK